MNMNYKICFVCTGNACRSPFAECVTKKLLADARMSGIEVFEGNAKIEDCMNAMIISLWLM